MNTCPIDERPLESDSNSRFCTYHSLALSQLQEAWLSWKSALEEEIPWESFLSKVVDLREKDEKLVGTWALEVAQYLLSSR